MKPLPVFLYLFMLISLTRCSTKPTQELASENIGSKIQLLNLEGAPVDLAQFKGKTVVLNFWATWCRPCVQEMPSFQRAQAQVDQNKVVFLFASEEEVDRIKRFRDKNELALEFVQITNLPELQIQVLPTTYIIDANGNLALTETGSRQWDDPAHLELITHIGDNK